MGLLRGLSGLFSTAVSTALLPVAVVSDAMDDSGATEACVDGIGEGVKDTLKGTITIISDPLDEDW